VRRRFFSGGLLKKPEGLIRGLARDHALLVRHSGEIEIEAKMDALFIEGSA
jgi:hypothetical protein